MLQTVSVHDVGDVVKFSMLATDEDTGDPVDPAGMKFMAKKPSGATVVYTYGTNPELVRTGVGQYLVALKVDEPGVWSYRWEAAGIGGEAEEGRIYVERSDF